jgi:hypothetical protein
LYSNSVSRGIALGFSIYKLKLKIPIDFRLLKDNQYSNTSAILGFGLLFSHSLLVLKALLDSKKKDLRVGSFPDRDSKDKVKLRNIKNEVKQSRA